MPKQTEATEAADSNHDAKFPSGDTAKTDMWSDEVDAWDHDDEDDEELEKLRDEDEWEDEPVPIVVPTVTSNVVSFRMTHEQMDKLDEGMRHTGQNISQFVRESIRLRLEQLAAPADERQVADFAASNGSLELDAVARIDGVTVADVVRTAVQTHVAARRRDPAFQARLRAEQTVLNSLVEQIPVRRQPIELD